MIAIIGAGISGLAAAYELTSRGVPFRLLEASDRAGGLIRTEHRDGYTIDAGADSILANKPSAKTLCAAAGLAPLLQEMMEPRSAFVFARGRLFSLPSPSVLGLPLTAAGAAGFALLPRRARLRLLLEPFVPAGEGEDESIASFFTRRFGASAAELVGQPLLGGIHAGETSQLSVRSLFPALLEAEASGGVLRGMKRRVQPGAGGMFNSLAGGMETLPLALSRALPPGAIRYGAEVQSVMAVPDGWRVEVDGGSERAAAVLFAAPVPVTARLLQGIAPRAAALSAGIPHASTVSVALAWPRGAIAHPLRGSGFVVARAAGLRVTACTWVSSKWEGRAPAGHALLRAFIGGVHDPGAIELPDDELVAIASRDLGRVLGIHAPPILTRVYRWRDASPQLTVGHEERMRGIEQELGPRGGIFVTGRGFRAVGIPDCIADARGAAAAAAEYITRRA